MCVTTCAMRNTVLFLPYTISFGVYYCLKVSSGVAAGETSWSNQEKGDKICFD